MTKGPGRLGGASQIGDVHETGMLVHPKDTTEERGSQLLGANVISMSFYIDKNFGHGETAAGLSAFDGR